MKSELYDVVVIGGGPVGSYVAFKLAKMGYGVAVVEQKKELGEPVCCTGIIGQECIKSFDIDDGVILRRVNSARVFSPSGKLLNLWRRETQASIVDRSALNLAMARRSQHVGVEYMLSSRVGGMDIGDKGVRIEASCGREKLDLEARAVVIATGFSSRLVEGLGFSPAGDFARGVQVEVETAGIDETEVYFGRQIAPAFFAWLVPTSSRKALVGLLSRHRPGLYLKKLVASLMAEGKIVSDDAGLSYGGVPLKPLARTYGKRLIIVGTAAGQVKPTNGGGIYYGLMCAEIAADSLHRALKSDDLSAKSLAGYERAWRRKLGWELRTGYWARKLFEGMSDRQIDRVFDIISTSGIDEDLLKADDFAFDWHGKIILKLIGYRALAKVIKVMKSPFR